MEDGVETRKDEGYREKDGSRKWVQIDLES